MARKHVINYYLEQQQLYFDMVKDIKDVEKDYKDGLIDIERYNQLMEVLQPDIEIIKSNYERLSYIVLLLNQPQNKKKEDKFIRQEKELYDGLQGASKEAVLDETKDALADLRKHIKEK